MQLQILEGRLSGAVDACNAAAAEVLGSLMEELVELPPDVPLELVALVGCAAVLPEKLRLEPDMRGLARGVVEAWKGEEIREDEAIRRGLWELVEFATFALGGRGFRDWCAYREAAEEGERRLAADRRAAENRAWAHRKGLAKFFDDLFRR